jgi:hypothetical protein
VVFVSGTLGGEGLGEKGLGCAYVVVQL